MTKQLELEPDDPPEARMMLEPDPPAAIVPSAVLEREELVPGQHDLASRTLTLVERAMTFSITTAADFQEAGLMLQAMKDHDRAVVEFFEKMRAKTYAAYKEVTDTISVLRTPIKQGITVLSAGYTAFDRQERKRAEELRRQLEREEQERERARLKAEADAREADAKKLQAAAMVAKSGTEAQLLQQQAEEAHAEAADLNLEAASVERPVVHVESEAKRAPGAPRVKANWVWELEDLMLVVQAVAAGTVSLEAVEVNATFMTSRAKAENGTAKIPGIRFYNKGSVASMPRRKP